jgi:uracil-DNA glycosylase family 4
LESIEDQLQKLNEEIIACRRCPRLVAWREQTARTRRRSFQHWVYWGKPVPGFGDIRAPVLVVGLAPGAHGANRTGRMFTGDGSGEFLYRALFRAGFANQPVSHDIADGLALNGLFISALCRCAPPENKPAPDEIRNCLPYLQREIELMAGLTGMVALGGLAFHHVLSLLRQQGLTIPRLDFAHGAVYRLGDNLPWIIASYHPSRQNTQTGRLTEAMFAEIWDKVKALLAG